MNAVVALLCLWTAVVADDVHWFLRAFFGVVALGAAFYVAFPIVERFANRNAKPF